MSIWNSHHLTKEVGSDINCLPHTMQFGNPSPGNWLMWYQRLTWWPGGVTTHRWGGWGIVPFVHSVRMIRRKIKYWGRSTINLHLKKHLGWEANCLKGTTRSPVTLNLNTRTTAIQTTENIHRHLLAMCKMRQLVCIANSCKSEVLSLNEQVRVCLR